MRYVLSLIFLIIAFQSFAQTAPADTAQPVEIIFSKNLYLRSPDASTQLHILSGKVQLKQGNTLFFCDSCVINYNGHVFEAFGNVHIIDNDTTNVYSDRLRYLTDKRYAYLNGKVKLTDGHATLTSPELEYDVANKIGTYKNGGRVTNKKSVLTSREGVYYTDLKDFYFKHKVELKDPAYLLKSDSLLYNTETQIASFIADTYIKDSSGRVVRTREGYYDVANGKAEFMSKTFVEDKSLRATADRMVSDDERGIIRLNGNAVVIDTAKGTTILGGEIFIDKKTDAVLARLKPLMIIKQDNDSIFVTADTLFSARLTELYKNDSARLDSLKLKEKDSTNRYFEAFRNVRVFTDSLQAVSDSLFYSFKDSTFQLFFDPVVWNKNSQVTGDTIYLYTKNKKADRIKVLQNSFMVNEVEPSVYNQIRSLRMDGYFKEGAIDSLRALGDAESVYFIQDDDSAYSSVNQTASAIIDAYFKKGELFKVVFRKDLKGTLHPADASSPGKLRLDNFRWLIARRPKSKFEMYE